MISKAVVLVSITVIAVSLYAIFMPYFEEERVAEKIIEQPVNIQEVEIDKITIKYGGRTFNLDPDSQEAQKLLSYVQQILPQLRVESGNLSAFMSDEDVERLMRNSSYVLVVLEEEKPISFGELTYPCRRLVVFLDGRAAGMLGVQPAGGAMQQIEPKWEMGAIPEESFSEFRNLVEEVS